MDAITFPPAPINEPNLTYAPGSPERAALVTEIDRLEATQFDFTATIGGTKKMGGGAETKVVQPHDHAARARHAEELHAGRREGRRPGRHRRGPRLARAALRREVRDPAQGRRPAGRPVAPAAQRRDHARPVEDRLPGRDRRRLRAHRLLALQRPLRQADPHRPADREQPRHLEPHRPPPARGLRLRDHAVQLHRDRRQPAHRPGADGQHGDLEAVADPAARRAPHHGAARGGRHAAGRDQHAPRRRPRRLQGRAQPRRPGRHPLHRLHPDLPAPVGRGRRQHREVPHLPPHRRRDRRQGLRRRAPLGRPGRRPRRDAPRCLRVPGPEVLGRLACVRREVGLEEDPRPVHRGHRRPRHGRRHRLLQLHGRGHRRPGLRQAQGRDRPRQAQQEPRDRRRRQGRRLGRLLRPARRSWSPPTRPTRCSRPSTSARSSPCTSTRTATSRRSSRRWSRSRRTR